MSKSRSMSIRLRDLLAEGTHAVPGVFNAAPET